jgi:hypothetical protein
MEYYAIRIYRREMSQGGHQGGGRDMELTGLLEDDAGRKETFHSAEELWRLLVRSVPSDNLPEKPKNGK